jgi:hypothetical protein
MKKWMRPSLTSQRQPLSGSAGELSSPAPPGKNSSTKGNGGGEQELTAGVLFRAKDRTQGKRGAPTLT